MFCGHIGGIIVAVAIPAIQLATAISLPVSKSMALVFLLSPFMNGFALSLFGLLWFSNMILWAMFCNKRASGRNLVIAMAVPAIPALSIDALVHAIDRSNPIVVVYIIPAIGYLLIAILSAYGSTGRGLAYDLGLKIKNQ